MTQIDLRSNPKYPLDESWHGAGKYRSMTSDLPWMSFYTIAVLFGRPRDVTVLKQSCNGGGYALVEDNHTGRWFMARMTWPFNLMQYCKQDSHHFESK